MAYPLESPATKVPLGSKPVSTPSSTAKGGELQSSSTVAPLGRMPVPSPSADPKEGERQSSATQAPLNRTPVKGWGSAGDLPMSERSVDQSKTK